MDALGRLHAAGLYRTALSYGHVDRIAVNIAVERSRTRRVVSNTGAAPPSNVRLAGAKPRHPVVVWDHVISPDESEEIVDLDVLRAEHTAVSSGPPLSGPLEVEIAAGDMEAEDRPFAALSASEPEVDTDVPADDGEPIFTRTLAELYAKQGAVKEAITVMKHLLEENPQDAGLARRIAELEAGGGSPRGARADEAESEEQEEDDHEVETLARDLAESGRRPKDVQSPFGWTDREPAADEPEGPSIRDYFDGLLNWEPRDS